MIGGIVGGLRANRRMGGATEGIVVSFPSARLVNLFGRAFLLVTLTAMNVRQISRGHYLGAFICGGLISYLWFRNVGKAAWSESRIAAAVYALGAGCGTMFGMWLTS